MTQPVQRSTKSFRDKTFRTEPGSRVHTLKEALAFINERGFVFFWPVKGIDLPSLWVAVAGDRPVPNEHDDPGHVTWGWKDDSLAKNIWYYAKVLHHRGTFISLETIPYFYALSPNFGDPNIDYLITYQEGKLSLESKAIYEALLREGPLDTLTLRKAARLSGETSSGRYSKGLDALQTELKVLPTGISQAGTWHYSYIYDLAHRKFPRLIDQARPISEHQARLQIVKLYLLSVGVCSLTQIVQLFRWNKSSVTHVVEELKQDGFLRNIQLSESDDQERFVLSELL